MKYYRLNWSTIRKRFNILISAILIVIILISPIGPISPEPVKAEGITIAMLASLFMGGCAIGMATDMVIWSFDHGGILKGASGNPEFAKKMGVGCFFGAITVWVQIPGVKGWLGTTLELGAGATIGALAEAAYYRWGEPVVTILIDNWDASLTLFSPVLLAYNMLIDEAKTSQQLYDLFYDVAELWYQDVGGTEYEYPNIPYTIDIIPPPNATYYQDEIIQAEIHSQDELEFCTDTENGVLSDIRFVQFGYAYNPNIGSIQPIISQNNDFGQDWYGCNGWGLEFDISALGISTKTPIYLAVRAEDIYGNLSQWVLSERLYADPRYNHDYSVTNLQISPAAPNANQNTQVSATIQNLGASNEGSVSIEFYVDNNFITSHNISGLNSGGSTTTYFNWTATEGAHTLRIESDLATDQAPGNNSASKTIIIGTAPLIKVNGSTTPPTYNISASTTGTTGTFSVPVQNVGSAATSVSVSKGGAKSSWLGITTSSFSVEANRSINYTFTVNVPANQSVGNYSAELYFDWAGTRTTLPIQISIAQYSSGTYPHTFDPASGTIDGRTDFLYAPVSELYKYLDNYSSTADPTYRDGYFSFTGTTFDRAIEACNWEVRGIENQASGTSGILLSLNSSDVATKTNTFALTCFPIFNKLINGQNYWNIGLTNFSHNANNVKWEIERNNIYFPIVKGAWASSSLKPGTSTVETWRDGWDYGRICGTVGSVTQEGDTDLYNNGKKVASKYIDSSDAGDEVCWNLTSGEVEGTNYYNIKPNGGTIFTISNLHFDLHYYTGQPSIQATRTTTPAQAQVGQDITISISLLNNGSNIADEPEYSDTLPPGLTLVSGLLNGDFEDVFPGQLQTSGYVVRASAAGAYTIPIGAVAYQDKANNDYQTTIPATTIEVWGGTLTPVIGAISENEVGAPILIHATVTDSLSGGSVNGGTVIANITKPNNEQESLSLSWNSQNNRFEGNYYPSVTGLHQVTVTASKPYYSQGSSNPASFNVLTKNSPPIPIISNIPLRGEATTPVTLDGRASVDTDGVITSYQWDIGNNGSIDTTGSLSQWAFSNTGNYTVKLTVTDNRNASASATTNVEIVPLLQSPGSVTASPVSDTSIRLNWEDLSTNETGFEIQRSVDISSGWVTLPQLPSGTTTFLDTGLECNKQHYYRLRAYRSSDDWYSKFSDNTSATTLACPIIAPEIDVKGNSISIVNGDNTPNVSDHTDFGGTAVSGGMVTKEFTILNPGNVNLNLSGSPKVVVGGTNAGDFNVNVYPSSPVTPGGQTMFTVVFDPSAAGVRTATLSIANNDPDEATYTFMIQGTGLIVPEMDVRGKGLTVPNGDTTPRPEDDTAFGNVLVSGGTAEHTFTVYNLGDADLNLSGSPKVVVGGTNAGDFSVNVYPSSPVTPGGQTMFTVVFDPSAAGVRTATLSIANNDPDEATYTFTIQGAGLIVPEMDVRGKGLTIPNGDTTPRPEDDTVFGNVLVSGGTAEHTFTIYNLGDADLNLSGSPRVVVGGANAGDFSVTVQPGSPVTPGGQTTFTMVFDPSAAGVRTATLSIANNDPDESPYTFTIQGTGYGYAEIDIKGNGVSIANGDETPNSTDNTDFGEVNYSGGTIYRDFTIYNTGYDSLTLDGNPKVMIEGVNGEDFEVRYQPNSPISPGINSTFRVVFTSRSTGLRTATLKIINNDSDENPFIFTIQARYSAPISTAPKLSDPANATITNDATPTLTWTGITEAHTYQIQIDNSSKFSSVDKTYNSITGTLKTTDILPDGKWYWRVRGVSYSGAPGPWSSYRYFTVDTLAPAQPRIYKPADGGSTYDTTPTLAVYSVSGAKYYEFEIHGTGISHIGTSTSFTVPTAQALPYWDVYNLHARAIDAAGNESEWVEAHFMLTNHKSPAHLSYTTDTTPTFSWYTTSGATGYYLEVLQEDHSTPQYSKQLGSTSSHTIPLLNILPYGKYYWRVRPFKDGDWMETPYRMLTVTPKLLTPPLLVRPASKAYLDDNTPELRWSLVDGAKAYELWVDNSSKYSSPEVVATIPGDVSYYTLPDELADGKYYWKLRTINPYDVAGSWRSSHYFYIDTISPSIPGLYKPADGAGVKGTPTFDWTSVSGGKYYQLCVTVPGDSLCEDDEQRYLSADTLTSTEHKPTRLLEPGTYLWMVKVRDTAGNWTAWSAPRTVTITNGTPPQVILEAPETNTTTYDSTPTFKWQKATYAQKYQIAVDTSSSFGSPYTVLEYTANDALEYTPTFELPNRKYYWRVRAINEAGTAGSWSSYRTIIIDNTLEPPAPDAPTGLAITATEVDSLRLEWTNQASDADEVRIERSPDGASGWLEIAQIAGSETTYLDENLSCDTPYFYHIRAYRQNDDLSEDYSEYTQPVEGRTELCPLVEPTSLTTTGISRTEIQLNWTNNQPAGDEIVIERSPDGSTSWETVGTISSGETSYIDSDLVCDTTYFYRAHTRSTTDGRVSPNSLVENGVTNLCQVAAPTELTVQNQTAGTITIGWTNNAIDADTIMIERSPDGDDDWQQVAEVPAGQNSYLDEGLTCSTTLRYRVRAYRVFDNEYSEYSSATSGVTSPCLPTVSLEHDHYIVNEGDGFVTIRILLDSPSDGTTRVYFDQAAGTASRTDDYAPSFGYANFFDIGQTYVDAPIPIVNDTLVEGDETFTVFLGAPINCIHGTPITATVTIVDNDLPPLQPPADIIGSSPENDEVLLTWENQDQSADQIHVERRMAGEQDWQEIALIAGSETQYRDTSLSCEMDYSYQLRSYRSADQTYSDYSSPVEVTTQTCNTTQIIRDDFNSFSSSLWTQGTNSRNGGYSFNDGVMTIDSGTQAGGGYWISSVNQYNPQMGELILDMKWYTNPDDGGVIGFRDSNGMSVAYFFVGTDHVLQFLYRADFPGEANIVLLPQSAATWHDYQIRMNQDLITAFIDGELIGSFENNIPEDRLLNIFADRVCWGHHESLYADFIELRRVIP